MTVDTPATIAILGAGPLGLEAALYARFLGYGVLIYERGLVAENIRRCGRVRLLSPFGACHSSLGRNAILAQQDDFSFPADDALLTGDEWIERYLQPLADSDLIVDHLRLGTEVLGVTRSESLKHDATMAEEPSESIFRIAWKKDDATCGSDEAEVVIDATGDGSQPNWVERGQSIPCERVLADVGQQPAIARFRELQVELNPDTEAPVNVSGDRLGIRTSEPNFYILGRKKFGRQSGCTFADGLTQIRDLFTIIGERETLDLYASNRRRT